MHCSVIVREGGGGTKGGGGGGDNRAGGAIGRGGQQGRAGVLKISTQAQGDLNSCYGLILDTA